MPTDPDNESTTLLTSILNDSARVSALDGRLLSIGRQIVVARKNGKLDEDYAGEFLRNYREWKEAQKELPFSTADWNIWIGRAVGWEQLLGKQGMPVATVPATPAAPSISGRGEPARAAGTGMPASSVRARPVPVVPVSAAPPPLTPVRVSARAEAGLGTTLGTTVAIALLMAGGAAALHRRGR